jgi:hypothetical protein
LKAFSYEHKPWGENVEEEEIFEAQPQNLAALGLRELAARSRCLALGYGYNWLRCCFCRAKESHHHHKFEKLKDRGKCDLEGFQAEPLGWIR